MMRYALPTTWDQRLEALLARVWARVERFPIAGEEVDVEVELARAAIYAQGRHHVPAGTSKDENKAE